jgi:hypothetical protein
MVDFFVNKLGISNTWEHTEEIEGGVFKAGNSWLEFWQKSECMNETTMLQLVVEDADEFASFVKANGVAVHGPFEEHGEKIYSLTAPNGMPMSIQSTLR